MLQGELQEARCKGVGGYGHFGGVCLCETGISRMCRDVCGDLDLDLEEVGIGRHYILLF